MKRFLPYLQYLRPVRWHFAGAVLCGAIYGAASGFGLPFFTHKVLPVVFGSGRRLLREIPFFSDLLTLNLYEAEADIVLVRKWPETPGWLASWFADCPPLTVPAEYAIALAIALLPCVFAVRASAHFGNVYLLNYVGLRVLEGVRAAVFARLQRLHLGYFKRHTAGDLTSRVMVDTNHVKAVVVEVSNDLIIQPFTLIGALGMLVFLANRQPGMGRFLVALALIPIVVLPVRIIGKKLQRRSEETLRHSGSLAAVLTENLQSAREVRAYNLEERETRRFGALVRDLLRVQLKAVKYDRMLTPIVEFLSACSIAFAVYQAAQAHLTQEDVIALVAALYMAYEPVKRLGAIHTKIKTGLAGLIRLEEVLHAPAEINDPPAPVELPAPVRGEIRFDNVTFAYDTGKPVLSDITTLIHPGETVALVGPSGAGKSTFANLVPRFHDPAAGAVRLDGHDLRTLAQSRLRATIALVSQEPVLFGDTVRNNILLGDPAADDASVRRAAAQAGALEFIERLPLGWDTPVGERGGSLSGGQRQRLAIARAFLKNAPVLILDEATSALDTENETLVQEALEKLSRGKTTLIIAHRFSTIRFATRILVFDRGRIVADGPHADLHRTSPLYRTLYDRQGIA